MMWKPQEDPVHSHPPEYGKYIAVVVGLLLGMLLLWVVVALA